jgi:hypothetical protein
MPLLPVLPGRLPVAAVRFLRGLALAGQARAANGDERGGLLAVLDEVTRWLAERAADAPENLLHLLRLAEPEQAWAAGDLRAARWPLPPFARPPSAGGPGLALARALIAEHAVP